MLSALSAREVRRVLLHAQEKERSRRNAARDLTRCDLTPRHARLHPLERVITMVARHVKQAMHDEITPRSGNGKKSTSHRHGRRRSSESSAIASSSVP